jgi:hypothetical protein
MATRAIMTLLRDGNRCTGSARGGDLRLVPEYIPVTWDTYEEEGVNEAALRANMDNIQHGPMSCRRVFAVWTAPFDETRFTVPMWVQERAAASEVVIRG